MGRPANIREFSNSGQPFVNQTLATTHADPHSSRPVFDEEPVLHGLKHYLPSQTPLKDFIHHNSLHAFQHLKFYDAIFKASGMFGYQVTLQLTEFRQLFLDGRIKEDILDSIITKRQGPDHLTEWKKIYLTKNMTLPILQGSVC